MDEPRNVKGVDFGAIGDGSSHPLSSRFATLAEAKAVFPFVTKLTQEIDWAAIQAAIWSAGTSGDPRGTTVLVPRGDYQCSDDLHISRQVRLAGMGRGATQLTFAPGTGVIFDESRTSPDGGYGTYATIADLDLMGGQVPGIQQWRPGQPYSADNDRVCDRNDNRFYYECIKAGSSRNTAPPWTASTVYSLGDVVRAVGPIYFQCTEAAGDRKSGLEEPVWALPVDETTWDGAGAVSHEAADRLFWKRVLDPERPPLPAVDRGTWAPATTYDPGDLVQVTATFKDRLFFRCQSLTPVSSGPSEPAWEADAPGELTMDGGGYIWARGVLLSKMPFIELPRWRGGAEYHRGDLVRAFPFNPAAPVIFECTQAGRSEEGEVEPNWSTAVGAVTLDGQNGPQPMEWTARADPSVFTDGAAVWRCRTSPGIWLRTQSYVQGVGIQCFTNAGLHIQAQLLVEEGVLPGNNVNHWQAYNAVIHRCGVGVVVMGSDVQGGTAVGLEVMGNGYNLFGQIVPRGNGGTGVYDRGNGPNNWIGCATEANTGRAFVAATSNAASTVLGCYIEGDQQPSYLGIGALKLISPGDDAPNSTGWIIDSSQAVGPFVVPNPRDRGIKLWVGYKSEDPTILYGWQKDSGEFWVVRWDETRKIWRTGADSDGAPPASYLTGVGHPRGTYLQGIPSLLLGDPAPATPIQVGAYHAEPPWTGEPGDIVFNSAQDSSAPAYQPYAGWICVAVPAPPPEGNIARQWRRFGKIEP
jgi:hypothetical protein